MRVFAGLAGVVSAGGLMIVVLLGGDAAGAELITTGVRSTAVTALLL
jgi:hypothetical protein